MKTTVIPVWSANKTLAFDLRDILLALEPFYSDRAWHFYELESSDGCPGLDYDGLQDKIEGSTHGLRVSYPEARQISDCIPQTVWALLVIPKVEQNPPSSPYNEAFREMCEVVVEFFDSTEVLVSTENEGVHERLRTSFEDARFHSSHPDAGA